MQVTFKPQPWFIDYTRRDYNLLLNDTITLDLTNQMFGEELAIRWLRNNETIGQRNTTTLDVQLDPIIVSTLYQLEASNPSGATLGPEIWIHPEPAPQIIDYSESPVFFWLDETPTLFMEAVGEGAQYRWYKGSTLIPFENSSQLTLWPLTEEDDGLVIRGEAFNVNGFSTAVNIALMMEQEPIITQQPETVRIFLNQTAELSVTAEGRSLEFQWRLIPSFKFTTIESETSSTIVVPNVIHTGAEIVAFVTVSNRAGQITSAPGFIVVQPKPVFDRTPRDITPIVVGRSNLFDRPATGGITYTWVLNGTVVLDNTSDTFWILPQVTTAYNGTILRVTASNPSGSATVSTTIVVVTLPELVVPLSSSYEVLEGAELQIDAVSASWGVLYEWRHNGIVVAANTSRFQIKSVADQHAGPYQLYMHNLAGTAGPIDFSVTVVPLEVNSPNYPVAYAFVGHPVTLSVDLSSQALSNLKFTWAVNRTPLPGKLVLTVSHVDTFDTLKQEKHPRHCLFRTSHRGTVAHTTFLYTTIVAQSLLKNT